MVSKMLKKTKLDHLAVEKSQNKIKRFSTDPYETIIKKKNYLYRPFVHSFSGHVDSVLCIKRHSRHSSLFFSGSSDGQVKFWIISRKKCIYSLQAHENFIRDLAVDFSGLILLSCSDDFFLKLWHISGIQAVPKACFENDSTFNTISTHPSNHFFATGGKEVLLWDLNKFEPIQKLFWGLTSASKIEFNPIEYNILSSCGSDRSILLSDLRLHKPVKKIFLEMRSNDISWNFLNPWEFTVANEDSNLYSFDLRNLKKISKIYKGHVMPVLSIDQDPNSQLFASGSFDSTIRLFRNNNQGSKEVFFTQRMRRVLDVSFSLDGRYLISASEDGDLRLWRKFEEKNFCNITPFNNKSRFTDNPDSIEVSLTSNSKLIPRSVKKMIYIGNIINKKKKKISKINIRNLPGYINFKFKNMKTN